MSSHREAPTISKDPVADNTDLYAFVDPVDTSKVTILSNFIPLEEPAGGPNFFQFGDDVLYEILIDNNGDGVEDVTYQFRFKTTTQNPATFLYNTGPIGSLTDPNWNMRQLYSVTKVVGPRRSPLRDRRLVRCEPAQGDDPGEKRADRAERAVGPGEPARRTADQRGRDRAGREGPLEQPDPGRGFPVPRRLRAPAVARPVAGPVPRRLPTPRRSDRDRGLTGRSDCDPPDGDSVRHHPWIPELEWPDPGGRAASEPRIRSELPGHGRRHQSARGQREALRPPGRRPGRLPGWPAGVRQPAGGLAPPGSGPPVPLPSPQPHPGPP